MTFLPPGPLAISEFMFESLDRRSDGAVVHALQELLVEDAVGFQLHGVRYVTVWVVWLNACLLFVIEVCGLFRVCQSVYVLAGFAAM